MSARAAAPVGRPYAVAHAYRRDTSREPAVSLNGRWGRLRIEGARRVPLPPPAPALLDGVTVGAAIAGRPAPAAAAAAAPDLERLATLLHVNLGALRVDLDAPAGHAIHRAIPSPGNLFPSELFVYLPGEGIYHFDVLRHDLGLVRGADGGVELEAVLGRPAGSIDAVLLVSSVLWRLVQKYSNFAYRLASLEAGHLVGNLLMTAAALGWRPRVQYLFDDDRVEACLGLPRLSVATMAAVLLGRDGAGEPGPVPSASGDRRPAGRWHVHPGGAEAAPRSADVAAMETAARAAHVSGDPWPAADRGWADRPPLPVVPDGPDGSLWDAIRLRHAGTLGPAGIGIVPRALASGSVAAALAAAGAGYRSDLGGAGAPRATAVAAAIRVTGLERGGYAWDAGVLRQVADAPLPAHALWYRDIIDGSALGVVWAIVADYDAAFRAHGDRGYRLANMEAGIVGQRLCLLGAARRTFARPFCAFDERAVDRWLGLTWSGSSAIYVVLTGADRRARLAVDVRSPRCGDA